MNRKLININSRKIKSIFGKTVIFLLMIGFSYVVLFPFFAKISSSLMSKNDLYDVAVSLVPREFSLDNFKHFILQDSFLKSLFNTAFFALCVSVCTVISATLVGYGLARFRFKGVTLCLIALILTMLIPSITIWIPLYETFRFFDVFGIIKATTGAPLNLTNTVIPIVVLAITSLGFKGGIHTLLMRQYFAGVPKEISEAAYVDGAGAWKTFITIMAPMAKSMMIVVFILSFVWQWTDTYFINIFYGSKELLPNLVLSNTVLSSSSNANFYQGFVYANAGVLISILPPLVIYIVFQKKIIGGIESAGLVG